MWDVFSLPDTHNKDKKWDILLPQYIFPLDYVKCHLNIIHKGSKTEQYVVQNLTCSGVYLGSYFPNSILQMLLSLVPLTTNRPKVYTSTMITLLSYSYDDIKSIKIKIYPRYKVTYYCAAILVDVKCLTGLRRLFFC